MKKGYMYIGILGILFLMVSTVTAVPTAQSKPLMTHLDQIEDLESMLPIGVKTILKSQGIIDSIIQLILAIINIISEIITIVQNIMSLVAIITSLIEAVQLLFGFINQLIDLINQILNPEPLLS